MGSVAGPYTEFDWVMMHALKADIRWYSSRDPEIYQDIIQHERGMLKDLLRKSIG